jgi:hypothetical protein
MEVPQGDSLYRCVKQGKMLFFFFYKIREKEGGTGPARVVGTSGKGEDVRTGYRRVIWYKYCVHMYDIHLNYSMNGARRDKAEWWRE